MKVLLVMIVTVDYAPTLGTKESMGPFNLEDNVLLLQSVKILHVTASGGECARNIIELNA